VTRSLWGDRDACDKCCEKDDQLHCLDLSYIHALLAVCDLSREDGDMSVSQVGYGLNDDVVIHISKKINGVETAWALGAMLKNMRTVPRLR